MALCACVRCRQTGKRLMAKCRMLLQENDELGINISSGRTAKLEGEVALEKKFVEEMKVSQAGARSVTSPCTLMLSCWCFWGATGILLYVHLIIVATIYATQH